MKKITLPDLEIGRKRTTKRWHLWLSLCLTVLLGSTSMTYAQGNTCTAPIVVTSLPYSHTENTATYGNDYNASNVPTTAPGAVITASSTGSTSYMLGFEVVYSITPVINGTITVNTTNDSGWMALWAFTGCPFSSTVGYHTSTSGGTRVISNLPVIANTTYYLVFSSWDPPGVNYTINITGSDGLLAPLTDCTETPTGGTASLTPNGGNAGSVFVAKAIGTTLASGLTYQWQKEVGGTWQDIAGATTINSSITAETGAIGTVTNYRLSVTCTNSNQVAYSTVTSFTIQQVYCTSNPTSNDNAGITNVALGSTSFTVADVTYYNHPTTVDLIAGITNSAAITFGTGFTYHANIWIDLNDNGTFEENEMLFQGQSLAANPTTFNTSFDLNPSATVGLHRMRIGTADSGQATPNPCYNGSYGVTVDVMVNILPPPTCLPPSALTGSAITSNSAILSWNSPGTSFEIQWGPFGFVMGSGTMATSIDNSYALDNVLTPTTKYSFYVRQNCGTTDGFSLWSGPYTFTTACGLVTAFTENFDSYTAGVNNPLPACWTRFGNTGSSYITTGSGSPMSNFNKLYLSGSNTGETNGVAVMPAVSNLQAETHRLRFFAYSTTAGRSLEIGYYDSSDDPESFQVLEEIEMTSITQGSAIEFVYEPQNVPEGVTSLAFRANGGAFPTTTTIYIDNVKWEEIPPCGDILASNITFTNAQTDSIDVEWFTETSETAWQYVYTSDAAVTNPNTLTPLYAVSNTPYTTIESLQSNTNYKFWMRSNCGDGVVGIWSGVKTFTTACAPVTEFPYVIDFESVTVPAIPNCTTIQNAGAGNNWKTTSTTSYGFSGKVLQYPYNGTNAANAWFYTNELTLEAGVTYKLTYKYGNDSTLWTEKLRVAYGTSAVDTDMVEELADHPAVTGGVAQDNSVSFTPAASGTYVIGFNAYSDANQNSMYVDNIMVDLAPTTLPVCATNILATPNATCGNYATTITWTASPSTDGYNVIIAPTVGGTPETLDAGNATTFSHIGNHNTEYTYTVVPYNNIGSAVGCTSQTFTTALNGCYCPSIPTSNDNAGISNVLIGNQNFVNADNMYFDHTGTPVDLAQGILANLKITLATTYSYHSNVWIDLNDNFTFEADELLFSVPTNELSPFPNPYINDASFEMPVDAPLGLHKMRIVSTDTLLPVADPCYSGSYGVTLDFAVNITAAPTCLAPSNASATNITTASVTLNWTASTTAPANGYDYYVTTSTTPPTAATEPTGTVAAGVTTAEVSGLVSSSVHKFYIRSVCSTSDVSAWTQAGTFLTLCDAAPLPYTIDFESVTVPNLPACTNNQNVGTGNDWKTTSGVNSGFTGKYLRYTYNASNAANTWFFTNVFNLVAGTSYTVSYKYGAGSNSYTEKLKVAYGNAANDGAMTTILADHDNVNSNVPQNNSVEFTPTTSGLYVIGFNAYSPADGLYLQVDDIVIMATPTCVPPAVAPTVTNITANTATVNWTASTTAAAEGYDYYYSTSATNPTAATTPVGSVEAGITTVNLTGLSAVSTYYVWVRSKCSSTDVSAWSYSATFTTPCSSYDTPFTEGFTTFLPNCWTRASAGTIATGPTNALAGGWLADGFLNVGTTGAARFNIYSTNRTGWLITPLMNTTVGESYVFSFDYGVTAYSTTVASAMGSDDTVKVAMSTDNGTTWTQIQNFSAASNITNLLQQFEYVYDATTTSVKFAFLADAGTVNDNLDYNFYVDNVAMDINLSNETFTKNTLTAYPNPVKNNLNIRYTESIKDVTVYNLLGQQMFTKNINATEGQIDMSNLASGTYLVKVNSGDKVQTMKVIKE